MELLEGIQNGPPSVSPHWLTRGLPLAVYLLSCGKHLHQLHTHGHAVRGGARCRAKHHGPICRSQRPELTALSATVCSLRQHMQHKHTEGIISHSVWCPGHLRSINYRPSLAHSPPQDNIYIRLRENIFKRSLKRLKD